MESNFILNEDTLIGLKKIKDKSIDSIITDLPYFNILKIEWDNQWKNENEYLDFLENVFKEYKRVIKENGSIMIFTGRQYNRYISILLDKYFIEKRIIIWYRKRSSFNNRGLSLIGSYEPICFYTNSKKSTFNSLKIEPEERLKKRKEYQKGGTLEKGVSLSDVWTDIPSLPHNSKERIKKHPSQKPLKLMERIILLTTNENDTILDNFAGTGTTLVAAKKLNRNYIGIESEKDYIPIINDRLIALT